MVGMAFYWFFFANNMGGGGGKKLDTFLLYPLILSPFPSYTTDLSGTELLQTRIISRSSF